MSFRLSICAFLPEPKSAQSILKLLSNDRYKLTQIHSSQELLDFIQENKEQIDCLVVYKNADALLALNQSYEQGILLPLAIVEPEDLSDKDKQELLAKSNASAYLYHCGEVRLNASNSSQIAGCIDKAIAEFLHLGPSCAIPEPQVPRAQVNTEDKNQTFLMLQQRRLADKLKERLGYLGVYYKRNPQLFYRNLTQEKKRKFRNQLEQEYREIILSYFLDDQEINQAIDRFVNKIFFADFSVPQLLEIHMELMDEFAQQLKLEGRNEEILLDYRLALIDIIAHLCEMYRRSIPKDVIPFDLLYCTD